MENKLTPLKSYIQRVGQKLMQNGYRITYDVSVLDLQIDVFGVKSARPVLDALSKVFALTSQQVCDATDASGKIFNYSTRLVPWKLGSFTNARVVAPVFVSDRFSEEEKSNVRRAFYPHWAAHEIPVLVEIKSGNPEIIFNRSNQLWGWAVLPRIIRTIDDVLST